MTTTLDCLRRQLSIPWQLLSCHLEGLTTAEAVPTALDDCHQQWQALLDEPDDDALQASGRTH